VADVPVEPTRPQAGPQASPQAGPREEAQDGSQRNASNEATAEGADYDGSGGGRKRRRRRRGRRKRGTGAGVGATTPTAIPTAIQAQRGGDRATDEGPDGPEDEGAGESEGSPVIGTTTGILDAPSAMARGARPHRFGAPPESAAANLPTQLGPHAGEVRVRQFADGLVEHPDDPIVPPEILAAAPLRAAQRVTVEVSLRKPRRRRGGGGGNRPPRPTVSRILEIEGLPPEVYAARKPFADLTPLDPAPRMTLEYRGCPPACRLIDLFCPIGFGTRGLIVAPPKAGKTILLQNIAFGIKHNHPQVELVALLIDERPEEVTDFKRNVPAQVLASSNDQDLERHLSLGILAIERAKRMVEAGKDVVVLLDSITRLGRAFNNSRRYGSSGKTMSGGLDSRALEVPKQLFGAARRAEEGGSLTIIATCLVDTGSRADQIIFEEFKGTGNMELILDRGIAERRLFPAINLAASGTRKEHLLMGERELKTVTALRRRLLALPPPVQIEQLLGALQRFPTNEALVAG
jgi:transcription termination factor Rho